MRTITVIGGGASGMMAAITAASLGNRVVLLEHRDRIGKKILSTGNGRCNFTNIHQEPICYHSRNPFFPWEIIRRFSAQDTVSFFLQLGVYSKNRNGYLYPNSDQASSVLDALRMELKRLKTEIRTDVHCREIIPGKKGFRILTDGETYRSDRVILCAGSKAAPSTGSDGSGYDLAKKLGHTIIPVLPALVQLKCEGTFFKQIAGVRANGTVAVYADGECLARDTGEIQLTGYGISGIPVFQVSRYAAESLYEKKHVEAVLDFMPDFAEEQLYSFFKARAALRPDKTAEEFLIGMFHRKLSDLWVRISGIPRGKRAGELTEDEIRALCTLIKQFRITVTGTNSFDHAQVCCGGVDTSEVNPKTLESRYVPGLYFAGEILDVDGMCGGYNLQWAWSSGRIAAESASVSGTA